MQTPDLSAKPAQRICSNQEHLLLRTLVAADAQGSVYGAAVSAGALAPGKYLKR